MFNKKWDIKNQKFFLNVLTGKQKMISLNQLEWKSIYIIHSEDQKKKKRQMNKVLENFSINIKYRVFLLYVSVSLSLHIDRWIYRDI